MRNLESKSRSIPSVDRLDPDGQMRLARSFPDSVGVNDCSRVVEFTNMLASTIPARINHALVTETPSTASVEEDIIHSKHLMTAVHLISMSGREIEYCPIKEGKRSVSTKHHSLLTDIKVVLDDSESRLCGSVGHVIPDSNLRGAVVSAAMDEVAFSIFSALRDDRASSVQPLSLEDQKLQEPFEKIA